MPLIFAVLCLVVALTHIVPGTELVVGDFFNGLLVVQTSALTQLKLQPDFN